MRGPHNIWRLIRTGATFERSGAMRLALEAMDAPPALRILARILGKPFAWLGYRGDPSLPPVSRALTALGPAYIKFGQIMSTRPDVVGVALADELKKLQDDLPPFDMATARKTIERELGQPADTLFSQIDPPLAAASLAQVHRAVERGTGRTVAIKVLRPGIERAFFRDVDAFYFAARMVDIFSPAARRLRPMDVIEHFESVAVGELDLRMEAAAAAEFRSNTRDDPGFTVPEVIWHLSAKRVMTLEWAEGRKFSDIPSLVAAGADPIDLSERVLQMFLKVALRDGFFHGDMHQGNLKLAPNGDIVALDFGIMGRIDAYTRRVYAEVLIGFLRQDYRRIAEVHFEAGYVPADRDIEAFAQALRAIGEPIFGQDARSISIARLLAHLFDVTERFGMETRTELILLQRTMVVVEGVSRSLNNDMNFWEASKPVVERYIRDNLGPRAVARDLSKTVAILARFGPLLPVMAENALIAANKPAGRRRVEDRKIPWWAWMLTGAGLAGAVLLIAAA
ncbi:MAG: 2-polyprenylphenol 6-hydroxylase [Pseudomonadota bacterium]